jgi:release factor family 2
VLDVDASEPFPSGAVELADLAETLAGAPPFVTVRLRTDPRVDNAARHSEVRWRSLRRSLEERGAPAAVLEGVSDLVPEAHHRGETLFIVADRRGIRHVEHGRVAEERDLALVGPLPHVLPLVRWRQAEPPHLVVLIDRTGADLIGIVSGTAEVDEKVKGETDPIRKVHAGGWSMRRYQERAENTWAENADNVAAAVEALARRLEARLVIVAGDVRAVALLREELPTDIDALLEVVPGERPKARDAEDALPGEVAPLVADLVRTEEERLLERAREERGQADLFAEGTAHVARALARAQVAILLVHDTGADPEDGPAVWIGPEAAHLSTDREELVALRVPEPVEAPAVDALLRAAVATDASVRAVTSQHDLREGVAALLRWKT